MLGRWAGGLSTYGDVVSRSGVWAAVLLIPITAVTPLRLLFSVRPWLAWLIARRTDLGVAAFAYSVLHAGAYLAGKGDAGLVLREARQSWLLAGWAALLIFVVFAAATDDAAVRALRRSWRWLHRVGHSSATVVLLHRALKRFHRVVYIGAALVLVHWALSAFDPLTVQVQTALRTYGYYGGPIDGIIGAESRAALQAFQHDHGLAASGTITSEVLDVLGIVPN